MGRRYTPIPQIPPDFVPLTEDLPMIEPGFKHISVHVYLLTNKGSVVPGIVRDEGDTYQCYRAYGSNWRRCNAIAWKSMEDE